MAKITTRINLRNDTLQNWESSTVLLNKGEVALARLDGELSDKYEMRIGVGDKTWSQLSSGGLVVPATSISGLVEQINSQINTAIEGLDVATISVGVGKTFSSIGEVDGKISADVVDISINASQVAGLEDAISSKLDNDTFNQISNDTGLSAASSSNPVATRNDISGLGGAMHFKGVVVKQEGETDQEAIARTVPDPDAGDVVMIQDSTLEYIYNNITSSWMPLGDETLYVTKAEYDSKMSLVDSAIDNKIYANGLSTQTLSVAYISLEDFHSKVEAGSILSNELYVVSSTYTNAFGERITNVGEPQLSSDAATMNYVDSRTSGLISNALTGIILNGVSFDVASNVASLSITDISCGNASA